MTTQATDLRDKGKNYINVVCIIIFFHNLRRYKRQMLLSSYSKTLCTPINMSDTHLN